MTSAEWPRRGLGRLGPQDKRVALSKLHVCDSSPSCEFGHPDIQSDAWDTRRAAVAEAGGMEPLLASPQAIAKILGVHCNTVDRLSKRGELPGRMEVSGQVRYHLPTIRRWLEEKAG